MRFALVVSLLASMPPSAGAAKAEARRGLSDVQFQRAMENISTAPNYVLVTIVNGKTGAREDVCLEAFELLGAIEVERGLGHKQAVEVALAQPDRTFTFTDEKALEAASRRYGDEVLEEARRHLGKMPIDQVEAATRDQQSELYDFCKRKPGTFYGRFRAAAHVLSERGVLCGRSCKPGLFYLDRQDEDDAETAREQVIR